MRGKDMMKRSRYKLSALTLAGTLILGGCGGQSQEGPDQASIFTGEHEIVTYKEVDTSKTVITIGKYLAFDEEPIEIFLETEFPEVDAVFVESNVGTEQIAYMSLEGAADRIPDLMFSSRTAPENEFLYDLSAEEFCDRYNLSALTNISVEGKIYQLPLTNTMFGLAYNKTLFQEKGWEVPNTLEEFYQLCDDISAQGIRPMTTSYKYYRPVESLGFGLSYDSTFSTLEAQNSYHAFARGEISGKGVVEPMLEALQGLYERGIIMDEDFTASATDRRQELYAGEVAMLPCNLDLLALYRQEKPECEIDFMGFPTNTPGERWMHMIPGVKLSVAKASTEDSEQKELLLNIVDRLSTNEGHEAILQSISGISSLSSYQQNVNFGFGEVDECLAAGRIFFADYFASNEFIPTFKEWITGKISMDEIRKALDEAAPLNEIALAQEETIGTAEEEFTILDTSLFMADVMRENTGAQIALIPNNYFYKGNFAKIFKGDITFPQRFVLKNIDGENALTTYEITGANLKKLMEHPIIGEKEINAMYACSGLAMEYAPWADADKNVISLTLADGTEIKDDQTYTVAAWASAIDESYLSGVVQEFPELGTSKDIMVAAIKEAKTIAPARDGRITLNWEERD